MQTYRGQKREMHLHGAGDYYHLSIKVASLFQKRYCLLTNSGTSAIEIVCEVLEISNKTIYTSNYHWPGAIAPFLKRNNKIFVGKADQNFSLNVNDLAQYSPDVVLAVDFLGIAHSNQKIIGGYCKEKSLVYLTDACSSMGTKQNNSFSTGYYSDVVVTSFGPQKSFYGGEGGAILTNSEQIFEACLYFIEHPYRHIAEGIEKNYYSTNQRMNPFGIKYLLNHFNKELDDLRKRQVRGFAYYSLLMEKGIIRSESPEYTIENCVYQKLAIDAGKNTKNFRDYFVFQQIPSLLKFNIPLYLKQQGEMIYTKESEEDPVRTFLITERF